MGAYVSFRGQEDRTCLQLALGHLESLRNTPQAFVHADNILVGYLSVQLKEPVVGVAATALEWLLLWSKTDNISTNNIVAVQLLFFSNPFLVKEYHIVAVIRAFSGLPVIGYLLDVLRRSIVTGLGVL